MKQYNFSKAGWVKAKSLEEAIRKITTCETHVVIDGNEFKVLRVKTDRHIDTLLAARGYEKPEAYEPPPADYAGEDDWLWEDIQSNKSATISEFERRRSKL